MVDADLAEATNVVRFPAGLRVAASAAVLDGLEPDPREVAEVAERLGVGPAAGRPVRAGGRGDGALHCGAGATAGAA